MTHQPTHYLAIGDKPITPCTLEQIQETLDILQNLCPQGAETTEYGIKMFQGLDEDMKENFQHGTDVNGETISKGAMAGYNQFLTAHPDQKHDLHFMEDGTILAEWQNEGGYARLNFLQSGKIHCRAGARYGLPSELAHGICIPSEIDQKLRELRDSQGKGAKQPR